MKALSIWQPWASLMALGYKRIETRSWPTKYRGRLLIHAAKRTMKLAELKQFAPEAYRFLILHDIPLLLPLGKIIGICDLIDCIQIRATKIPRLSRDEFDLGDYTPGRYAWITENMQSIDPIPCSGRQGLWEHHGDIAAV